MKLAYIFLRFMIFVDHDSKNVVFAIRGTFAMNDLVIDALCDEVPFLDGFAHRGMVNVSTYIERNICIRY